MALTPDPDHFLLGLFSPNCSSGLAVTTVRERWSGSWEDNLRCTRPSTTRSRRVPLIGTPDDMASEIARYARPGSPA